jgi:hypothetical protein
MTPYSGTVERKPDGTTFRIDTDGAWEYSKPSGKVTRGKAANTQAALTKCNRLHKEWILRTWQRGRVGRTGRFVVPLS